MPRNVEIKAAVENANALRKIACLLSGGEPSVLEQRDTYYYSKNGRLKLREKLNDPKFNQLIFYSRGDVSGPKLSTYYCYPTDSPELLGNIMALSNGVRGVVKKTRYLYWVGQTRVHVDEVEGLGNFMELEVKLRDDQTAEEGEKIAHDLMDKLGIKPNQLITGGYMDM